MELVIQTIINTLILSSMYILIAMGFAFLFNMLGILNLAHGAIYMIGGYIGYIAIGCLGINPWLGLILIAILGAAFGIFLEKYCFRPFVGDFNRIVMVCIGITVILQTTVNIMVGSKTTAIPSFVEGTIGSGAFSVSYERVVTFAIGAIALIVITWIMNHSMWGKKMKAISQDSVGASLQGINIQRTSAIACALGCGLATVAGCLMGAYLALTPFMGDMMLIKVLMLVMLAGAGSLGGIFVTGLILGAMNATLPVVLSGSAADAVAVVIVVIIALLRPQGFFGHEA